MSTKTCRFWMNGSTFGRPCGKSATHIRKRIITTEIKGSAAHQFAPPDEYYCQKHAEYERRSGGNLSPI